MWRVWIVTLRAGIGAGWRAELALDLERRPDLAFVEVVAESIDPARVPHALHNLRARGIPTVVHGVGLSLGGAEPPSPARLSHLARLAEALEAPLVSEHVAFVRAAGRESGHLLPVARHREGLACLAENVRIAQRALPVPLALENIACLFEWPDPEHTEADFLAALLEATGAPLLLDLANLHANVRNLGVDAGAFLDRIAGLPIAYVHAAGGVERGGLYHDTHAHPLPDPVLALVTRATARLGALPIMLERDDHFPDTAALYAELDALGAAQARGLGQGPRERHAG